MVRANQPYRIWLEPEVHQARNTLPGNLRQRIKKLVDELASHPKPINSKPLDTTGLPMPDHVEMRRIRLEHWRLIYAINDQEGWLWVLAIHRRPPYDYENLPELVSRLKS